MDKVGNYNNAFPEDMDTGQLSIAGADDPGSSHGYHWLVTVSNRMWSIQ